MPFDFVDILAPITPDEFRRQYYDRQPLYIPGGPDKFAGVLDWNRLSDLLNINALWTADTLQLVLDRQRIPPGAYCTASDALATMENLRPDPARVTQYLSAGASLVLNDIDSATPEIRALAGALEEAFNAKGQCNLYCSWLQHQAFFSHYDTHEVVAIHLLGQKDWRVYANRAPHPINHPLFKEPGDDVHEHDRGDVMMAITMKPGDVLYLPRGWYHDALASSEGCVHLTFGLSGIIGLDLIKALGEALVGHEAFRRNAPLAGEGRDAMTAYIRDLTDRLVQAARSPAFQEQFERFRDGYRYQRGGYQLPITVTDPEYRLTQPKAFRVERHPQGYALVGPGGGAPIPPGFQVAVGWIIKNSPFPRSRFTRAFSTLPIRDLDKLLSDLCSMKVLASGA